MFLSGSSVVYFLHKQKCQKMDGQTDAVSHSPGAVLWLCVAAYDQQRLLRCAGGHYSNNNTNLPRWYNPKGDGRLRAVSAVNAAG